MAERSDPRDAVAAHFADQPPSFKNADRGEHAVNRPAPSGGYVVER